MAPLGKDALTVISMPTSSGDRTELWRRFLHALELPSDSYDVPDHARSNVSLGAVDAEMLRRVNAVRGTLDETGRVRELAHKLIRTSPHAATPIVLPDTARAWVRDQSRHMVAHLDESGYRLIGSSSELLVADGDFPQGPTPDDLGPDLLLESSVHALARLVGEARRQQ